MTRKYYLTALISAPSIAFLIAFTTMNVIVALVLGLLAQGGFTMAGYYLGKRE